MLTADSFLFEMKSFYDLQVWHKAHALTLQVYRCTTEFPSNELYGLTSQTRRASASIGANLAEGCGYSNDADFARYCVIALGSASELEYHLLLAKDLKLLKTKHYTDLTAQTQEVKRMLTSLIQTLKK